MSDNTLEQRVIAWLRSEGWDAGGAPCARGTSLVDFVKKEIALRAESLGLCAYPTGCAKKRMRGLSMCRTHQPFPAR